MRRKNLIGKAEITTAREELLEWHKAREEFAARVADEENWYRRRVAPRAHRNSEGERFAPTSAWLFNSLMQKHADMMENLPTAALLPREEGDEEDARALSVIVPVVLDRANFASSYSDNMWYKLKHGVCAWGVFWNNDLENGIGDIDVRRVEMANLYWQPGVRTLQESKAVYFVDRMSRGALRARFPRYEEKQGLDPLAHRFLTGTGESDEVVVVDWYYKKRLPTGRTVLHYCKFAGETVLFSSENDPLYQNGWYEHGLYPFVLDVLYPIEHTCLGFGVIALGRDPQQYIDRMDRNLLEYMDWATRVRYFCKKNTGVNEEDFCDLGKRIVEVEGDPDEERLRQIDIASLDEIWLKLKEAKIKELKETTASRDLLHGRAEGGVTAAAAIAALQEAGNKSMRDIIAASYRAFVDVVRLIVECVRQFYGEMRCFRILGTDGTNRYLRWSSQRMREASGDLLGEVRRPIFDIDVRAERKSPHESYVYNELMKELYRMGVFHAENAAAAEILLSTMNFDGVESVRARIKEILRRDREKIGEARE